MIAELRQERKRGWLLAILVICLFLAYTAGFGVFSLRDQIVGGRYRGPEAFSVFWEAWNRVEDHFSGSLPSAETRIYGAIHASLGLLDPYTIFVEPQPRELERDQLRGVYGGIGVSVWRDAQGRMALDPCAGSPAERAGLCQGGILLAIDGEPVTEGTTVNDVEAVFHGEVGTYVTLTISCADDSVLEATIMREQVKKPSVTWRMERAGIGYIGVDRFTERTDAEIAAAVKEFKQAQIQGLVLDLRGNVGGVVDSAVGVVSQFVEQNEVVLYERSRAGERAFRAGNKDTSVALPLVVLVDGGTASAAEIVAGALQDHDRALLIGEATFGKGSVQEIFDLANGSSVHVTTATWLTPDRHRINDQGLMPDIVIRGSDAPGDEQLDRAVVYLESGS